MISDLYKALVEMQDAVLSGHATEDFNKHLHWECHPEVFAMLCDKMLTFRAIYTPEIAAADLLLDIPLKYNLNLQENTITLTYSRSLTITLKE